MSLPLVLEYPTYTIILPSNNKSVTFRPFIEKERKILLMAAEGGDDNEMLRVIKDIIRACCQTQIDVDALTTFDVEYFFLNLRAKSIGEKTKVNFRCENLLPSMQPCNNIIEVDVDITTASLDKPVSDGKIQLDPNLFVKMQYPTFGKLDEYSKDPQRESLYGLIALCIEYIASKDGILYAKDYTFDDLLEFVLSLNPQQFNKLEEFIDNMPAVTKKIEHACKKCGYLHELTLKGYRSFFL